MKSLFGMIGKFVLSASAFLVLSVGANEAGNESRFKAGEHYNVLPEQNVYGKGKVIEFFTYSCPYCFRAQEAVRQIEAKLPESFFLESIAVTLGKSDRISYAYTNLLLKELKLDDRWHPFIFHVSQYPLPEELKKYNKLWAMDDVREFFKTAGFDSQVIEKSIKEIDEKALIRENDKLAGSLKVKGTPTFVVDGKFMVEGIDEGLDGVVELEELVLHLVDLSKSKASN